VGNAQRQNGGLGQRSGMTPGRDSALVCGVYVADMKRSVVLVLAAGLALAGCGSGSKQTTRYATSPPTTVGGLGVTTSGPPPPISRVVTWPAAQRLLKRCRVRKLEQTHSRVVTLRLRGGGAVTTHEPTIDDIFKLLARLPRDCQPHSVATE
jgi:hypothetical protein